jgi:N-acetylneuraminic acid mutarotase
MYRSVFVSTAFFLMAMCSMGADLDQGLVAHYPFNGNANDESGNGNHGTVMGATLASDRAGTDDSAYSFNGSSSHIVLPNGLVQQLSGTGPMSVSCWFKGPLPPGPANKSLLSLGDTQANRAFATGIQADGTFFYTQWGDTYNVSSQQNYADDSWHHHAAVFDGSMLFLYLDGTLEGSRTVTSDRLAQHGLIGAPLNFSSSDFWNGKIDDVRIYNRSLSTSDAGLLFREGMPIEPRHGHIAANIGGEMIIFGGSMGTSLGSDLTDTGYIYNPVVNTWRPINTVDAPSPRIFDNSGTVQSYPWTGAELIIWGGKGANGAHLSNGARYNPATDTWIPMSNMNAPLARDGNLMLWTGSEILVWGGRSTEGARLDSGARYNPATDTWATITTVNAPTAREQFNAVWTGTEMIVWGGFDGGITSTGGRYNPTTDTWTTTSTTAAPALQNHVAVWTGEEMIIWGGFNGGNSAVGARYNPAADSWTLLPASPLSARRRHSGVWTGSQLVLWAGGGGGVGDFGIGDGGLYDLQSNSWTLISEVNDPTDRLAHTSIWTGTEVIFFGGQPDIHSAPLASGGRYNPLTDTWATMSETLGLFVPPPTPTISAQPAPQSTQAGTQVTFSVGAMVVGPRRATATGQVNNGFLTQVDVVDGGGGYAEGPAVQIIDSTGSGAVVTAMISAGGIVTGIMVNNPGSGYSGSPTITIDPPPSPELLYQWRKDGSDIPGANGSNYVIPSPASSDIGEYTVLVVLPGGGSIVSQGATLTVDVITMDIQDQFIHTGNNAIFSPVIMGVGSPSYQWKKDGVDIPNATAPTLTINAAMLDDAGKYFLTVSDAFTIQVTQMAKLTVSDFSMAPVIRVTGQIGDVFRIEKTTSLEGTIQWNFITDITLTEPLAVWVDLDNPLPDKRFYRVTPVVDP